MTRFRSVEPEQRTGDWLLVDGDSPTVTAGFQIEGDVWHLGWSSKAVAAEGFVLTLPVVERLLILVTEAIEKVMDEYEFDLPLAGQGGDE